MIDKCVDVLCIDYVGNEWEWHKARVKRVHPERKLAYWNQTDIVNSHWRIQHDYTLRTNGNTTQLRPLTNWAIEITALDFRICARLESSSLLSGVFYCGVDLLKMPFVGVNNRHDTTKTLTWKIYLCAYKLPDLR